jgi:hypothetical protein
MDIQGILGACDAAGMKWAVVEQDGGIRPQLESVEISINYLKKTGRA